MKKKGSFKKMKPHLIKDTNKKAKILRKDFPILNKTINNKKIIYFDNAATSQKPKNVILSEVEYYKNYNANVHRSGHELAIQSSLKIEDTRKLVKDLLMQNLIKI